MNTITSFSNLSLFWNLHFYLYMSFDRNFIKWSLRKNLFIREKWFSKKTDFKIWSFITFLRFWHDKNQMIFFSRNYSKSNWAEKIAIIIAFVPIFYNHNFLYHQNEAAKCIVSFKIKHLGKMWPDLNPPLN